MNSLSFYARVSVLLLLVVATSPESPGKNARIDGVSSKHAYIAYDDHQLANHPDNSRGSFAKAQTTARRSFNNNRRKPGAIEGGSYVLEGINSTAALKRKMPG